MQRIIEFVGNHPILFVALLAVLGMIAFFEYQNFFSGIKQLSPMEATRMQNDDDALFVDVRDDKEFKAGHILGARHVPVTALDKRMGELEKYRKKPLIVYCSNGARQMRAATKLKKNNFETVYAMAGGLGSWEKASMPLSTKD